MIPKSLASTRIGEGNRFSEKITLATIALTTPAQTISAPD
jgi:hypothetical protein